jgi:hypothetical protein
LNYLLSILLFLSLKALALVEAPNYDFSLDKLSKFMPGQKIAELKKTYGDGFLVENESSYLTLKFYIDHIRYKFPIFVQVKDGVIQDFHARLPHYFLHDVFHHALINRYGPQDIYKKLEEQAFYVWKNAKGMKHVYSGGCTITCFTIYYAVMPSKLEASHTPLFKKLNTLK